MLEEKRQKMITAAMKTIAEKEELPSAAKERGLAALRKALTGKSR